MTRKKHKNYSKTTQKTGFSDSSFYCNCCDYLSSNNSNYKKHLRTKKHLENYSNFSKTSKSLVSSKNKFFCVCCDYSTSRKSNWARHIKSIKHLICKIKLTSPFIAPTMALWNSLPRST